MDKTKIDKQKQLEIKSRLRLIDDQARPLTGSEGQYTRLAYIGYKPEKGLDRYFVLFAESEKLFRAVHSALNTPEWIQDGFENKWIYIEEAIYKPTVNDTIDKYLILVDGTDMWIAVYDYVRELGILDSYARIIKAKTFGLPKEVVPAPGFPPNMRFTKKDK